MAYTIHYTTGDVTGEPYCFDCGSKIAYDTIDGIQMGKAQYWRNDNQETRVHLVNSGENKFTCSSCGKEFGPFVHVMVISDEFS